MRDGAQSSVRHAVFSQGGGEMGAAIRQRDWTDSPLGTPDAWPQSLKTAVRIVLACRQPMFVWWGEELLNFHNDACQGLLDLEPVAGEPASQVWREIWDQLGPHVAAIMRPDGGSAEDAQIEVRLGAPGATGYEHVLSISALVNDDGELGGVLGVYAGDVLEAARSQQALRKSEARFAMFMQHLPGLAWIKNVDGRYVYVNDAAEKAFQKPREELCGRRDDEIFPEATARQFSATDRQSLADGSAETIETLDQPDGVHHSLVYKFAIPEGSSGPPLLGGIAIDVTERIKVEQALRDSEERFRILASHAPVGIFESDAQGNTIFVNEGWCAMAGLTPEQARGDGWADAIHPEDRERILATWREAVAAGAPSNSEFRFIRPDGLVTWLQGDAVPIRDAAGQLTGYIGTIADVTVRKEAEAALRNSERMYRAVGESLDYGIWVADAEGRNIYASESFLSLVGMTQEQCSNLGWSGVLHPDDAEQTIAAWKECVRNGDSWDVEHRFRGVDGRWHPILARGVPVKNDRGEIIAWVGINLDISDLKQVESDLRESEARFRHMADNAPVLIWVNGVGGCQFVNKEYLKFVGCSLDEVLGMNWQAFIHPDDGDGYVDSYLAAFEKQRPFEAQVRMRRADGKYRWFSTTAAPRFRADGVFLGYVGCSVDITDIKASEDALREADRRKDDFLAMLGHELRNPLAGIVTGAQVLSMLELDQEAAEMRAVISRQAIYMSRIVDDLLDVSRIARGKLRLRHQHANLSELLRNTVEDYRKGHTLGQCQLEVDIPQVDVWVWADPARLTQAFSNVIHNSYKFSDGPNVIRLAMRCQEAAGQVTVDVSDRGIGMAPDTIERIFEPFTQADNSLERSRGGLGLGLALARGLILLHGGSVTAASDGLGKGATISIALPTISPPMSEADVAELAEARPRRVLIIDDRRDAILPLQKMLQMDGHEVVSALDGPAGLAKAVEFLPEVVLCDIGLVGEMNGYGVSQALRAMPTLAISSAYLVAVTGYGHEEARRMAREAGFDFHVTKPVGSEQLRDLMTRMPRF